MEKALLEYYLDQGLSLPQIGTLVGRDSSTVGYWVQKYGLVANGREKYAPRGGIRRELLEELVEQCLSQRQIADELSVSISTVRHWLHRYGLETKPYARRRMRALEALRTGCRRFEADCIRHGRTEFVVYKDGRSRCTRCAAEAVVRRRRRVKQSLLEEAGGKCQLCGYDRHPGALQFHHPEPGEKEFAVSRSGITRGISEVRAEARKCVLLCANCHAEVEGGIAELPIK
jgi:transposase